jgi:tetratricopeptide (TPR) repeat protein
MILRQLGVARAEISLRDRSRSLSFLVAVGSLSVFLAAETLLVGAASSISTPSEGRLILALDSNDPQLHDRLAQVYKDPAEIVRHLRRATELSPYSRLYWSDLAGACDSIGDTQCADRARERLLTLCPMVPLYHWQAAEAYLSAKRLDEAVAQFRRSLELDPKYALNTWASLRTVQGPDLIFQELLADWVDPEIKIRYVDFLSDQGDNDAAYRVWRLVVANPRQFSFSSAKPYLERLIGFGRMEEAASVWQDLERLGIVRRPDADEKSNLIFNGDFEQLPLNAGFDWRWSDQLTYLALDAAAPGAFHGAHCLRLDFTVNRNDEYEPVYQIVPVLPNHAYMLQAYVRSEDITSDTGPSLRVSDTKQSSFPDAITETTVGTTPWHPVRLSFSTGPRTQSVRLSVWRPRGRAFPTEISGSFWLDAVSLESMDSIVTQGAADGQH